MPDKPLFLSVAALLALLSGVAGAMVHGRMVSGGSSVNGDDPREGSMLHPGAVSADIASACPGQGPGGEIRVEFTGASYAVATARRTGFFQTGQHADILLSGVDFNSASGPLLFNDLGGIASDGSRLLLADRFNNRILVWNSLPTGNQEPDLVLDRILWFSPTGPEVTVTPTPTPTTPPESECVQDANGIGDVVDIQTTAADLGCHVYLPLVVANWRRPWPTPTPTSGPTPTASLALTVAAGSDLGDLSHLTGGHINLNGLDQSAGAVQRRPARGPDPGDYLADACRRPGQPGGGAAGRGHLAGAGG